MEMSMDQIRQIIHETTTATVMKLKAAGLLQTDEKTAYEKTECLLRQYPDLKKVDEPYARRVAAEIDACLEAAKNDPYVSVIDLYYFQGLKNAACAQKIGCDERTSRRNRRQLVEQFSVRLASEEFIRELLM